MVIDGLSRWWSGISLRTKVTGVTVLLVTLGLIVAAAGFQALGAGFRLVASGGDGGDDELGDAEQPLRRGG